MTYTPKALMTAVAAALTLSSCHETIHIHPWDGDTHYESVLLTLDIDNEAPPLGAIVDYTLNPPVIVYSDNLPTEALSRSSVSPDISEGGTDLDREHLKAWASQLADALEQVAPYNLDGDTWEIHLKYEIYACPADRIGNEDVKPAYSHEAVYRADEYRPVHDVGIEMPVGVFTVVATAHIIPAGTSDDWFFNTSTLHAIACNMDRRNGLQNDNIYRDCFSIAREFDVLPTGIDSNVQHFTATLRRPQGRYVVLADDYADYLSLGGKEIGSTLSDLHYPSYVNVAYSLLSRRPVSSDFNFGFNSSPSMRYAGESPYVCLGEDWSIVNEPQSNIIIDIKVVDKNDPGSVISDNPGILVPLFSDRTTLVVGHWMTETHEGGGGVSVDPDFSNEIVIHF